MATDNTRTASFISAVRLLKKACDDEIEHTAFSGGGVRFTGFYRVSCRKFTNLLRNYGKRAVFKIDMLQEGAINIDCYDDIEPEQISCKAVHDVTPSIARSGPNYTFGSIVYSPYMCSELSSENIQSILLNSAVLDIIVTKKTVLVLNIDRSSISVVGGLASQLHSNPRMRYTRDATTAAHNSIMFKNGGPAVRAALRKKRSRTWRSCLPSFIA